MSQVAAIEPSGPEPTAPAIRHRRNRRGEGARLGDEIIEAALAIIDRTGSDDAVTLRAVAREVGIAAPSIYAHFADRDAIVLAAVSRTFSELYEAIVAGIAEAYKPDQMVGRKVVIVANLQPRKLRGIEANGMIVAASLDGGKPVLAGFLEDVPVGARLK